MADESRSERIRRRQQDGPPPSPEDAYKALLAMVAAHLDCTVKRVGRCQYCTTHGVRLWQGTVLLSETDKAEIRAECERLGVPVGTAGNG